MNIKKSTIAPWQRFARKWQKITSPGRPTPAEISIYKDFAKLNLRKGCRVLVLGATPEIRDMLAKYRNVQIILVDINLDMILAMTSLMRQKRVAEKEIWIRSNWLSAPLPKNYFDVIYGDFVLGNMPFKLQAQFLNNIRNWLKPNGYFITRCEGFSSHYKTFSISELCELFKNKPINQKTINLFWEIGVWLTDSVNRDRKIRPLVFYKRLKNYLKKCPNQKISKILQKGGILYPLNIIWYTHTVSELKKLFLKYFTIVDSKFDPKINFIYPDIAPIYKLRPKK